LKKAENGIKIDP